MPFFEAVDAAEGDTILLRFQDASGRPRMWLIDGGPKASERPNGRFYSLTDALLPRLAELRKESQTESIVLDLVVCTHIDDDHINGIERLMRCKAEPNRCGSDENRQVRAAPVKIREVWFNSFSALLSEAALTMRPLDNVPAEAPIVVSVKQGDDLTKHLNQLGLAGNSRFDGLNPGLDGLVAATSGSVKVDGIDVTILAPGPDELNELRAQWLDESRVISPVPQDLAPGSRLDDSVANLSSIVMLVDLPSPDDRPRRVLLTGDARGDHVVRGYHATGGPVPLPITVMKVPHHGAYANMHRSLLETFPADHYVFSANGKNDNPDPPVVEALVRICAQTRDITLHFTNEVTWPRPYKMYEGTKVQSLYDMKAVFDADPNIGSHVKWNFRRFAQRSIIIDM